MTTLWLVIAMVSIANLAIKAAGPIVVGGRALPSRLVGVIALLAPALLTALVVADTFSHGGDFGVDAKAAGVGAAGVAVVLRAPLFLVVVVAAATTALVRLAAA